MEEEKAVRDEDHVDQRLVLDDQLERVRSHDDQRNIQIFTSFLEEK